jgi:predicted chitinase
VISAAEFAKLTPRLTSSRRASILPPLQAALEDFGVTNYAREACFMGQVLHECGGFRWPEELASGAAYEGRRDLGNTQPGDGRRFKGRGWIQITGRANYRKYGRLLGVDLEADPERAATPALAARIACAYWKTHGLNELADAGSYRTITRRINGGLNGYADRLVQLRLAQRVLSKGDRIINLDDRDPEAPVKVVLQMETLAEEALLHAGRVYLPLRKLEEDRRKKGESWLIRHIDGDNTLLEIDGHTYDLPALIVGGTGYVRLKELANELDWPEPQWNSQNRTVEMG